MNCKTTSQKSPFSICSDIISLLNPNKLIKKKEMNRLEQESVNRAIARISEYPSFKDPIVHTFNNLEGLRGVIERASGSIKEGLIAKAFKYNISYDKKNTDWVWLFHQVERCKEAHTKANKYNTPYNKNNIDGVKLVDQVEEWEYLLEEAKERHLKVDPTDYDPIGLQQRIEEEEMLDRKEMRDLCADYCANLI